MQLTRRINLVAGLAVAILCCAGTADAQKGSATKKPSTLPKQSAAKARPAPVKLRIGVPCRAWVPKDGKAKVVLLCIHGLGLNSDSYEDFGKRMAKVGVATFAVDVRGFGTWMLLKGKHNVDFKSCLSDVEQTLGVLHTAYPSRPIFVLGESMGGAIALRVAAEHPELVNGMISSDSSGDRFHTTKDTLKVAFKLATFQGNKQMDVGTNVIDEATDKASVKSEWKDDPLNRMDLSAKDLWQFQKFMNGNHESAKAIKTMPVLFVVGLKDQLVKPKGTIELYQEIASPDKQMMTIRSAEHLIFEEGQCTPAAFAVVRDWLNRHSTKN
jgi:acylglycerol lipase